MATQTATEHAQHEPVSPLSSTMHGATGEHDESASHAGAGAAAAATASAPDNDDSSSLGQVHEKEPPAPVLNRRQKFKRHCGRFWWWYLIALIILLAILLPILFTVIIPALTQKIVSDQKLPVHNGAFRALSPTELMITLNTTLDTPLPVTVQPMALSLYNKDTKPYSPFATLQFSKEEVNHKTYIGITNQTVAVKNETELIKWFSDVFDKPEVKLSVKAQPTVNLGKLKYKPKLDKTLELPALNHLQYFGIEDMQFMLPPDENGNNMKGHLNLPNAGVLTLGLGNLTFNLLSGNIKVGMLNIYDVELAPGNNSRRFDGSFYFEELVPNLSTILESQQHALGQGMIEFNSTGNATIVNGKHINYIEQVLNKNTLTCQVPLLTLLGDVLSGVLDNEKGTTSLLGVFGDVFGNTTLLEHVLDHWDANSNNRTDASTKLKTKRAAPGGSLMWNMLRLAMRTKK